jgi:hypothetical protein
MAMTLQGENGHYKWSGILLRHWLGTARECRFPAEDMDAVISDLLGRRDEVIERVAGQLPASFPGGLPHRSSMACGRPEIAWCAPASRRKNGRIHLSQG